MIASHLVFADPERSAADADHDPDVIVSRTAELLHPVSHEALADQVGDLRLTIPDSIGDLPIPPLALLRTAGAVPAEAERIVDTASTAWSVILRVPDDAAVDAHYAARAAAALLVAHSVGVGVDLAIPRIWPRLDPAADPTRTADWFVLDRTADDAGRVSTTTRGLSRFGVPELRVVDVDATQVPAWDAVLTGLGHRLVASGSAKPPNSVDLGLRDIAAGYAEPVDSDDPTLSRATTVELTPSTDETLDVSGTAVADLFGA